MKKKTIVTLLALVMIAVLALTGCGGGSSDGGSTDGGDEGGEAAAFKVGFICLHDENSTYDLNFINGAKEACEELGVEYEIRTNIPEGQECYDAAAELADSGCGIIFADSFGH